MQTEENSSEDGAEETDRKGAGEGKKKRAPKDPEARRGAGFLCTCARVWATRSLNRARMAPRGSIRPNVSDPLISRRRRTRAPSVSPTPAPPCSPDRDALRGFSGGIVE